MKLETPSAPKGILSSLKPERWRRSLEEEGVTAEAEITDETREGIANILSWLGDSLTALQFPIRRGLEELLLTLAGKSFGSLEANQAVARGVQELLNRLGLRVACP